MKTIHLQLSVRGDVAEKIGTGTGDGGMGQRFLMIRATECDFEGPSLVNSYSGWFE